MRATEILRHEHRLIEKMLNTLDQLVSGSEAELLSRASALQDCLEFFIAFADQRHHAKEEDLLFPAMEAKGFSTDSGPTVVMRSEHVEGRALTAALKEAVSPLSDARRVRSLALQYTHFLREHIGKEDHCLFPMADALIGPATDADLQVGFARVDDQLRGSPLWKRWEALGVVLEPTASIPSPVTKSSCCSTGSKTGPEVSRARVAGRERP
jgi:hemerythrin-like domain-containing protein